MDAVFEALGDPTRRLVLELLSAGEQPAGRIVAALRDGAAREGRAPISQPAVSQHLAVLRRAGLVTVRADGTRRRYALDPAGLGAAQAWLARLTDPIAPFAQPLDALATEIARGHRPRRAAPAEQPARRSGASRPA